MLFWTQFVMKIARVLELVTISLASERVEKMPPPTLSPKCSLEVGDLRLKVRTRCLVNMTSHLGILRSAGRLGPLVVPCTARGQERGLWAWPGVVGTRCPLRDGKESATFDVMASLRVSL